MKFLIQYVNNKQQFLIKILINIIILLTLHNHTKQHSLANVQNNHIDQTLTDSHNYKKNINDSKIRIQANQAKFYLTETTSYFSGNVIISYNENILYADEIYVYKKSNHDTIHTILSGTGNIYYNNNIINMTGQKIISNIQNKDTDLYQGNFSFIKQKTYGSANHIKQRNNNRYTILHNANFSTCLPHKKYWNISGSEILYDHKKDNLDIWNAYFKIKKIPVLYLPHMQLFLSHKDNLKNHPAITQYNNKKHGIEIKLPYFLNLNNNIHGTITTNLIPKTGIQFQNYIQYFNNFNEGAINFDLFNNKELNKNYWLLHWYNNNYIHNKYRIYHEYMKINDHNYLHNTESKHTHITNNYYVKKNISWQYINNTTWGINLFYKEFQSLNKHIQNIYNTTPQLNINFYADKYNLYYHLFSQITQFTNTNHNYPKTTRLHIAPCVNILSEVLYTHINTEIKINNTYYQQRNIDIYNQIINTNQNIYLKRSVNRCLPQIKSNAKLILYKKNKIHNKYKQILEPKIQYLYIPYRNQKNIGLYDTTILEITNHNDLFTETIYSGLDRIASANQLTTSIYTKIYNNNNNELFHMSLGQTYFFTPQRTKDDIKQLNIQKNNITWASNTYWKINRSLGINTNIQYNTKIKKFKSGNTIIEHRTNNNKMIQMNFRYLNTKYFAQISPEPTNPIYQNNITQIGIIGNWPINTYWTINSAQFYNIKNKHPICQNIGIQYRTCCWKINTGYERKYNPLYINKTTYNNKLSINLTLSSINYNSRSTSKICNALYTNILPYQTIL